MFLRFNHKIYKKKAVQKSVSDYAAFANFNVKEALGYTEVKIARIDQKFRKILVDEFNNYVLGMTKKCS